MNTGLYSQIPTCSVSQILLPCLNNNLLHAIFRALKAQQNTLAEMEQEIPLKSKD